MRVLGSYDQKNDSFLDREKVIDMGRLRCPDTPKAPPKTRFFPDFQEKCTFFENFCKKVWKVKFYAYLCNPKQQKRWW